MASQGKPIHIIQGRPSHIIQGKPFHMVQGKQGEDAAVAYLKNKGHTILERNFSIRGGEIDIISLHNNVLVFTEVKTRSSHMFGTPLEAITSSKLKKLVHTAEYYAMTHKNLPSLMRIDAISVEKKSHSEEFTITHVENIG